MHKLSNPFLLTGIGTLFLTFGINSEASALTIIPGSGTGTANGEYVIAGTAIQPITSFSGSGTAINLDLGSGVFSSGEISFSLDTSSVNANNTTNTMSFDFDTGIVTLDVNLLVTSTELQNMGGITGSLHLVETATLPEFNLVENPTPWPGITTITSEAQGTIGQPLLSDQSSDITATSSLECTDPTQCFVIEFVDAEPRLNFSGGGTITSGDLAGFEYSNFNWKIFYFSQIDWVALYRGLFGGGDVVICKTPEPSTLLGLLGVGMLGFRSIITRKNSKKS